MADEIRETLTDLINMARELADQIESDGRQWINMPVAKRARECADLVEGNLELLSNAAAYRAALVAFSEAEPVHDRVGDDWEKCRLCVARTLAMRLLDPQSFAKWIHEGPFTDEWTGPIVE